jgi:hypothetical protein
MLVEDFAEYPHGIESWLTNNNRRPKDRKSKKQLFSIRNSLKIRQI